MSTVDHPDVDKVTFTGSPGVGRGIMKGADEIGETPRWQRNGDVSGGDESMRLSWTETRRRRWATFPNPEVKRHC